MMSLHEVGPPPFLNKTFEMVEDPQSDQIVSWGATFDSFIVWDEHKFCTDLLPLYFKHSNYTSFVRQLNTYGFRKVNDRLEYANPGFQKGQKHLLKTIKRQTHGNNKNARLLHQKQTEIDNLKREQEALKVEILDLKQQQQNSDSCLAAVVERMKSVEWKQREFVMLLAKAMKRTTSFQQLLQSYRQKKVLGRGEAFKKRRLASSDSLVDSCVPKGVTQNASSDQCHKGDMYAAQSEANSLGPSLMPDQKSSLTSEASGPDLSSGSYIMWEKLMADDVICEDNKEEELLCVDQTNYVHELEDLLAKPPSLIGFTNVGEIACPIGQ